MISLSKTIVRTRQEIADLGHEQRSGRTCDDLRAVIQGTAQAMDTIQTASECVDALTQRTREAAIQANARAIQTPMQVVFETCNIRDLTGQRIFETCARSPLSMSGSTKCCASGSASVARQYLPSRQRTGVEALLDGPVLPGEATISHDAVDQLSPRIETR